MKVAAMFVDGIIAAKKPVIVIAGAPKSGKTTAARSLIHRFKDYVYVSPVNLKDAGIMEKINGDSCKGIIMEGFPLTLDEVKKWNALNNYCVINVNAGDTQTEEIVELFRRASSSWICPQCGREYNNYMKQLPETPGICDYCQTQLIRKPQDQDPRVFKKNLNGYYQSSAAVREYLSEAGRMIHVFYQVDGVAMLRYVQDITEAFLANPGNISSLLAQDKRAQPKEKTFGHFDQENQEYVITNPNTPAPWINYLGLEKFFSLISHRAGGFSFYRDAARRRMLRKDFKDVPEDNRGRQIYVRLEDGTYWSATGMQGDNLSSFECRHGLGYTCITTEKRQVKVSTRYFVPQGENLEVWETDITNNSNQPRTIRLFPMVEFAQWEVGTDTGNLQRNLGLACVEVIEDGRIIIDRTEYGPRNYYKYFASSVRPESFDTDLSAFLGCSARVASKNGYHNPVSVTSGRLTNSSAYGGNTCAAQCIVVTLKPGETKKLNFLLGYSENPHDDLWQDKAQRFLNKERITPVIEKYLGRDNSRAAFTALKATIAGLISNLRIHTPDNEMDTMVNAWHQWQDIVTFNMARSASYYEAGGRGIGFRDACQDLLGVMHMHPFKARIRERILDLAAIQKRDGSCYHQYSPLDKKGSADRGAGFCDDPCWLIITVSSCLKEYGDWGILDEMVDFDNNPNDKATLYEHLIASFMHVMNNRNAENGLPLIGKADWNDCLNLNIKKKEEGKSYRTTASFGLDEEEGRKAVSLMIAGQCVLTGKELIKIAQHRNDAQTIEIAQKGVSEMTEAIYKYGWDGKWYIRAIDRHGNKIGSHENREGQIHLESNVWITMAGVGIENGYSQQALESVMENLFFAPAGTVILQPSYTQFDLNLGEITDYLPGHKENGSAFTHSNAWVIIASSILGRSDIAMLAYKTILPAAQEKNSHIRRVEPYVYSQTTAGPDSADFGSSRNSWLTGTAAINFYAVSQYILGIHPEYEGLRIQPCIPESWNGFTAQRIFRGATYQINVKRIGKGNGVSLKASIKGKDIQVIEGNLIVSSDKYRGKEIIVEVSVGEAQDSQPESLATSAALNLFSATIALLNNAAAQTQRDLLLKLAKLDFTPYAGLSVEETVAQIQKEINICLTYSPLVVSLSLTSKQSDRIKVNVKITDLRDNTSNTASIIIPGTDNKKLEVSSLRNCAVGLLAENRLRLEDIRILFSRLGLIELLTEGFIQGISKDASSLRQELSALRKGYVYISLLLGGTHMHVYLVSGNGDIIVEKVIKWQEHPLFNDGKIRLDPQNPEQKDAAGKVALDVVKTAAQIAQDLIQEAHLNPNSIVCVSACIPGQYNLKTLVIGDELPILNIPCLTGFEFGNELIAALKEKGIPNIKFIDIDMDSLTAEEAVGDFRDQYGNILPGSTTVLGSGIGGRGSDGRYGAILEIGHNIVPLPDGHYIYLNKGNVHPVEAGNNPSEIVRKCKEKGIYFNKLVEEYAAVNQGNLTDYVYEQVIRELQVKYPDSHVIRWYKGERDWEDTCAGPAIQTLLNEIMAVSKNVVEPNMHLLHAINNPANPLNIDVFEKNQLLAIESTACAIQQSLESVEKEYARALTEEAKKGNQTAIWLIKYLAREDALAFAALFDHQKNNPDIFATRLVGSIKNLGLDVYNNEQDASDKKDIFLKTLQDTVAVILSDHYGWEKNTAEIAARGIDHSRVESSEARGHRAIIEELLAYKTFQNQGVV